MVIGRPRGKETVNKGGEDSAAAREMKRMGQNQTAKKKPSQNNQQGRKSLQKNKAGEKTGLNTLFLCRGLSLTVGSLRGKKNRGFRVNGSELEKEGGGHGLNKQLPIAQEGAGKHLECHCCPPTEDMTSEQKELQFCSSVVFEISTRAASGVIPSASTADPDPSRKPDIVLQSPHASRSNCNREFSCWSSSTVSCMP